MEIKKFLGLKNVTSAERLKPGHLELAQNVDLDDTGKLLTRLGTTLVSAGSTHSVWADGDQCLLVRGQDLCQVNLDLSLTVLTRLSSARRVSYVRSLNTIYYSNGVDKGRVHLGRVGEWGVRAPVGQPVAAPGAGALPAGRYLYALTFLRSGQESGTPDFGMIELSAPGGIAFSSIESSSDPEVTHKALYLSGANGEELFRMAVLPASASAHNYLGAGTDLGARLDTDDATPPVAGSILEVHSGLMYVARDNAVHYSEPYNFERFRFRDFLLYPGPVTMFAAVNDGVYVSTPDGTWFNEGTDPRKMTSRLVFPYGAIPGTAAKTTAGSLKALEEAREGAPGGTAVLWTTPHGVCVGAEGGVVLNLTERDFSFPSAQRGAGVVRAVRGYTQYLSVLEGTGVAANPYS